MPDTDDLLNGAVQNSDGHGFAIVDRRNDRIIVRKGMRADEMIDRFEKTRERHKDGPAIFHSRWTTDGIDGKYNVHPFHVAGYSRTVLAHNGIFPNSARPRKGDFRSDTRIVAESFLRSSGFKLYTRKGRARFGNWMGSGNKVAILTLDPRFQQDAYIINEHLGHWDKEKTTWHSNYGYFPYTVGTYSTGYAGRSDWADEWEYGDYRGVGAGFRGYGSGYGYGETIRYRPDEKGQFQRITPKEVNEDFSEAKVLYRQDQCVHCLTIGSVAKYAGYCMFCNMCQDCNDTKDDCICYIPEHILAADEAQRQALQDAQDERDEETARLVDQIIDEAVRKHEYQKALSSEPFTVNPDLLG